MAAIVRGGGARSRSATFFVASEDAKTRRREDDDVQKKKKRGGRRRMMCARRRRDRVSDRAGRDRARGKTRGSDESVVPRAPETVARGDARSRASIASLDGVPEKPDGTRARFGTAATRVFKMARGSTDPPLEARGSGRREGARHAARTRIERASGDWIHRTPRATNPDAALLVQIAHVTASLLIRSPLVSFRAIGFRGEREPRRAHAPSLPSAGVRSRGA